MNWQEIETNAQKLLVDIVWNQWALLGSMGHKTASVAKARVIDPEALALASIACQSWERRLGEILHWWADEGSPLLSIQRMKKMAPRIGDQGRKLFAEYAAHASQHGHRSWKKYADHQHEHINFGGRKGPDLRLREASALMLKLRAAFGVSTKTDVLAYLISTESRDASVPDISEMLGYTPNAVRSSLKEMTQAGIVYATDGRPAMYSTKKDEWTSLLGNHISGYSRPIWVPWSFFFEFLLLTTELQTSESKTIENDFVLNSRARDLIRKYRFAFRYHKIAVPDDSDFSGGSIRTALLEHIQSLSDWVHQTT